MTVSSIGSGSYATGQMTGMGRWPGPAEMFNKIDEDTTVESLISEYDEDGDGTFSEDEALAALEANRPEGPPPPHEEADGISADVSWAQANGLENYMMMANLGMGQNQSTNLSSMFGGASTSALFSVHI